MAELKVEKSIEVEAPAVEVWDAMMDVKSWPQWKPFMPKASLAGGYESVTCGTKIKMSVMIGGPASVPLKVSVVDFQKPGRLAWEGGVKGVFHAIHSFDFKDKGGKTLVTSREIFTGALLPVVKLMVTEDDLNKLHEDWVKAIKKRVENKPEAEEPAAAHGH
ncbi:MAG TPA: SRPBCC domain-containing protein [bacterium]|nr:SRPBCC domain-containing protein [bacterium]